MMSKRPAEPAPGRPSGPYPGQVLRTAGEYAWRLLGVGAVVYFLVRLLSLLSLEVIPFVASLLVTALLHPFAHRLRGRGVARGWATLLTMLMAAGLFGGLITVVVVRATQQAPQLGDEITKLLPQIRHWLIHGPLQLNPTTVDNLDKTITNDVTRNSAKIASTALSTGKTVLSFLSGLILAIFSTIFLIYDGDRVWAHLLKAVPPTARDAADAGGRAAWLTLSHYVRGTLIVATWHGVVVSLSLSLLGVPLSFPLAVLVGLGSFVPLVGAVVTGALAVAVAGLSKGLVAAVIVAAVLLLDSQIEAHLLQPFVVGRYVRIHPLAVVLSLAAGAILFGIVGAIVAVPVVATINSAVRAATASSDHPADGSPAVTATTGEGATVHPGDDDRGEGSALP